MGTGVTEMSLGSQKGLHVVVDVVEAVRRELSSRGVKTSEVQVHRGAHSSSSATRM